MDRNMSKRAIVILISAIIACGQLFAKDLIVSVQAKQEFTGEPIRDFTASLVPQAGGDTIRGAIERSSITNGIGMRIQTSKMVFYVPNEDAEYTLSAYAPGFENVTCPVSIKKHGNRDIDIELDDLIFEREGTQLKEVVVTASKVKFYARGDTMVYNADAFLLPEGTMLDVLIKQLPGVEIRDGGEIYVNGKYVESLLLNGSDFFDGNKQLMLKNLASYTVKDISVYDKMSEKSKLAEQNLGDSEYVMDVKLKRDYMSGFVGNIEGAEAQPTATSAGCSLCGTPPARALRSLLMSITSTTAVSPARMISLPPPMLPAISVLRWRLCPIMSIPSIRHMTGISPEIPR